MSQYVYMQIEHKAFSKKTSLMDFLPKKLGWTAGFFLCG